MRMRLKTWFSRVIQALAAGGVLIVCGAVLVLSGCAPTGSVQSSSTATAPVNEIHLPQKSALAKTLAADSLGGQSWVYTVPNTSARAIEAFYKADLPQEGWTQYSSSFSTDQAGETVTIMAEEAVQTSQQLRVIAGPDPLEGVTPPAGGVSLEVSLLPTGV